MSGSFAELMKVAQANTLHANREALEAAKRRESAIRKQREEQEKKEREEKELLKKLMIKRLEDQKKEEERKKQREEEIKKRKQEAAKKKELESETQKHVSGTASSSGASSSKAKSSHSYIVTNAAALTREEKRMMKDPLFVDQVKARNAALKKRKDGRLPGGAISGEAVSGPSTSRTGSPSMTARARMAMQFPPTLMKLNTEKRDTRSIDEISRDLKRKGHISSGAEDTAILNGEQASTFSDWFGKKPPAPPSPAQPSKSKRVEGSNSKAPNGVPHRPSGLDRDSQRSQLARTNSLASSSKAGASSRQPIGKSSSSSALATVPRKRSRGHSDSLDEDSLDDDSEEDRRYAKRRAGNVNTGSGLRDNMRDMIWKIMGKDRSRYADNNVDSDDDMEVTGAELEREERISARIARKEDADAEAEERRKELEKKRRKSDKDRAVRR